MLKRDVLHSLNASALHADCSAADGLNSAYAEAGNAKIAKPRAAVTPFFRIVVHNVPFCFVGAFNAKDGLMAHPAKRCCDGGHKNAEGSESGIAGPPGRRPNYPWNEWP